MDVEGPSIEFDQCPLFLSLSLSTISDDDFHVFLFFSVAFDLHLYFFLPKKNVFIKIKKKGYVADEASIIRNCYGCLMTYLIVI